PSGGRRRCASTRAGRASARATAADAFATSTGGMTRSGLAGRPRDHRARAAHARGHHADEGADSALVGGNPEVHADPEIAAEVADRDALPAAAAVDLDVGEVKAAGRESAAQVQPPAVPVASDRVREEDLFALPAMRVRRGLVHGADLAGPARAGGRRAAGQHLRAGVVLDLEVARRAIRVVRVGDDVVGGVEALLRGEHVALVAPAESVVTDDV